jgi:hypothetical protein
MQVSQIVSIFVTLRKGDLETLPFRKSGTWEAEWRQGLKTKNVVKEPLTECGEALRNGL